MALTLILSIGQDAELLSIRNFVLQSAGYFVVPAYSLKEAADHFAGGDFDLVLLCQSIPIKDKDRLISTFPCPMSFVSHASGAGGLYNVHFKSGSLENRLIETVEVS
jgi:hypothetical protein